MPTIRKGTAADLPQIAAIYNRIHTQEEAGQVSIGWIRGVYPTEDTARSILEADELFVLEEDGAVAAAARINREQVPEYAQANWSCLNAPAERIMVLHTLVVDPLQSGRGLGSAFVRFYEAYALEQGCPYLRMDTNEKNKNARTLYAHLGYREAGIVPCSFNGIPGVNLVCLEKTLDDGLYIRTAQAEDLDAIAAVEAECFPPAEAAGKSEFASRLAHYSSHFWLLFQQDKLIAFVDGMVTDRPDLTDEMYEQAQLHDENGAWQMIFGVNTLPQWRKRGCAGRLLRRAIADARAQGRKGLVLTCKDRLIHYYAQFGFVDEGISASVHGSAVWNQMRLTF